MRLQTLKELLVSKDHSSIADALAEEIKLDINAFHAQLDKLLMQTTSTNVFNKQLAAICQSDSQEIPPTVEDANNVISHQKFQTTPKQDVFEDLLLIAIALKEEQTEDTHVFSAQLVKLETQLHQTKTDVLSHNHVLVNTLFNLQLIEPHVEDVKHAPGQEKFQINSELLVSLDHLPNAQTALLDNHPIDIHASNAQLDKLYHQPIHNNATLQLVLDNTKLDQLLTTSTVVLVKLANGHNTCQTLKEPNACLDHQLTAQAAQPEDQMMDTHALTAQSDKYKIQTILRFATFQFVMVNMISDSQSTLKVVEDANHANGQDKFQTTKELLVSPDHSPNAQTA